MLSGNIQALNPRPNHDILPQRCGRTSGNASGPQTAQDCHLTPACAYSSCGFELEFALVPVWKLFFSVRSKTWLDLLNAQLAGGSVSDAAKACYHKSLSFTDQLVMIPTRSCQLSCC